MEKISIIIPAYNAEKYIKRCLDSVIQIKYFNKEIIVIDDGSEDDTGDICDIYAQRYNEVKVFHKKNGGVSSARNMGLDIANGKYIFFVDSDDSVEKDYVDKLSIMGDEDFVQGGCKLISNDFLTEVMTQEEISKDYARYWLESPCVFVWSNCYKKQIIDEYKLRFDENVKIGEDARFNNSYLSVCKKIRRVSFCPYIHYDIESSAVHKLRLDTLEIAKEECMLLEHRVKSIDGVLRLRWYYWHLVFTHYETHKVKNTDRIVLSKITQKIKEAYQDHYFKESILYIRKQGSLDEKIESILMGYYRHLLFKPIMRIIKFMYMIKNWNTLN